MYNIYYILIVCGYVHVCVCVCVCVCCFVSWCRGEVDDTVWRFLLTGGVALDNPHPNPFPEWLGEKSWGEIVRASSLPNLKGWMNGLSADWKKLYDSTAPQDDTFPEPWQSKLKDLERLVHLGSGCDSASYSVI